MTTYRRYLTAFVLAVALTGCGTPSANTPTPVQNSPQSTVALTVKTVADSASTCIDTVIALRDTKDSKTGQGKITPATATTIGNWCSFIASTDKKLTEILANGQPWATQKAQILTLLATVTAPAIAGTIDPGAKAVIAQILTLLEQIRAQVQS